MPGGPDLPELLEVAALLLFAAGAWGLHRWLSGRRHGRLAYVDDSGDRGGFVSPRHRLVGRPDEVRRLGDGRPVPVEWKTRTAPALGPPYSHRIQVWAYCLLLEDVTGFPPPYGVVRYSDGTEFRLAWDEAARQETLRVRRRIARPYEGSADPSPSKCARCPWRPGCDARAPLPDPSTWRVR
ncbi:MAG TPA: PD-(D/E)XK nuclease family protein [Thermoplasmata archaeon]|nr:PD-(D/E)XK nuclease family protein [Thermoplasmata archaeon]